MFRSSVKAFGKRLLHPLWARLWVRIERRVRPLEDRLNAAELETRHVPVLDGKLHAVEDRVRQLEGGWRQHVPALLNAASSVAAFGFEISAVRRDITRLDGEIAKVAKTIESGYEQITDLRNSMGRAEGEIANHSKSILNGDAEVTSLWKSIERANSDLGNLWKSVEQSTRGIGGLSQRIEFVRREIMYEFKYGLNSGSKPNDHARILSPEKVDIARGSGIRLNLGCGHVPLDGYINVDQRELPGVDIISDVGNLPFEERSLAEIFSAHVLEHFPQERLRRLLPYWCSLLRPKGVFRAVVPDGEAMLAGVAAGTYCFEHFREVLFGAQDYEGDFHFNLFTPESLTRLLVESGLRDINVPVRGRRNGHCFEFEIEGMRE